MTRPRAPVLAFILTVSALVAGHAAEAEAVRAPCTLSSADDALSPDTLVLAPRKPRALADWNVRWHRRQRLWATMTATNHGEAAAAVRADLAVDLQPDGSRASGINGPVLQLAPHGTATRRLALYIPDDAQTAGVLLHAVTPDAAVTATLALECSEHRFDPGEMASGAAAALDEGIKAYGAEFADPVFDPRAAREAVRLAASGAQDAVDTAWALRALMGLLHDETSYALAPGETRAEAPIAPAAPPSLAWNEDGLPVLRLATVDARDDAAQLDYATRLHQLLASAAARRPRGWIVDLRDFGGGDPWAPLAALGALLQGPAVGAFVGPDGSHGWLVDRGAVRVAGGPPLVDLHLPPDAPLTAPVAVVIGPGTAGAGETLAIAFEGRPRTRFFGAATQGRDDDAIDRRTLSDGTVLGVVVARRVDRKGTVWRGPIDPDQPTDPHAEGVPHEAVDWLLGDGR